MQAPPSQPPAACFSASALARFVPLGVPSIGGTKSILAANAFTVCRHAPERCSIPRPSCAAPSLPRALLGYIYRWVPPSQARDLSLKLRNLLLRRHRIVWASNRLQTRRGNRSSRLMSGLGFFVRGSAAGWEEH